ncbi:ABC transporter permease, partial [Acinetobacter baumannii]
ANSVGRDLRMEGQSYRIVGVMKEWSPEPHFYDLTTGSYGKNEDLLLPISTSFDLKLGNNGNMNCFGENPDGNSYSLNAPCAWLQY